mgnify:CR=1 FL=1
MPQKIIAQTYDGGAVMSGNTGEMQAKIRLGILMLMPTN